MTIRSLQKERPIAFDQVTGSSPDHGETIAPTSTSGAAPGARVVAFYHRPVEDWYHGGSRHFKGFVQGLRDRVPVTVVAPERAAAWGTAAEDLSVVASIRNIFSAYLQQVRFLLHDARLPAKDRCRVLVVFDFYAVPLPLLWAKIRRVQFVFSPQDLTTEWIREFPALGYRGGFLLGMIRGPLDRLALSSSRLVVAVSDRMASELEREGLPSSRLRVCTLKRAMPQPVAADVARWTERLEGTGRVMVVFVGSTRYPPSRRSCEFIVRELAPSVRTRYPHVRFVLVGAGTEAYRRGTHPNVVALGRVSDLDGLLFACQLGLAPSDVTGGTSGKIVDYVLHGLRVLATPQAAGGVSPTPLITVCPLPSFAEGLARLVDRVKLDDSARPADPLFVQRYTEMDDLHRLGEELRHMADAD